MVKRFMTKKFLQRITAVVVTTALVSTLAVGINVGTAVKGEVVNAITDNWISSSPSYEQWDTAMQENKFVSTQDSISADIVITGWQAVWSKQTTPEYDAIELEDSMWGDMPFQITSTNKVYIVPGNIYKLKFTVENGMMEANSSMPTEKNITVTVSSDIEGDDSKMLFDTVTVPADATQTFEFDVPINEDYLSNTVHIQFAYGSYLYSYSLTQAVESGEVSAEEAQNYRYAYAYGTTENVNAHGKLNFTDISFEGEKYTETTMPEQSTETETETEKTTETEDIDPDTEPLVLQLEWDNSYVVRKEIYANDRAEWIVPVAEGTDIGEYASFNLKIKKPDGNWEWIYMYPDYDKNCFAGQLEFGEYGINGEYQITGYLYDEISYEKELAHLNIIANGLAEDNDTPSIDLSKMTMKTDSGKSNEAIINEVCHIFLPITDSTSGIRRMLVHFFHWNEENKVWEDVGMNNDIYSNWTWEVTKTEGGYIWDVKFSDYPDMPTGKYVLSAIGAEDFAGNEINYDLINYLDNKIYDAYINMKNIYLNITEREDNIPISGWHSWFGNNECWIEGAEGTLVNADNNSWTADLYSLGWGGIWGAQVYRNTDINIEKGKKYTLQCNLKSEDCDKWVFIGLEQEETYAYGKWVKLQKGVEAYVNESFVAKNNADCIRICMGGEVKGGASNFSREIYDYLVGGVEALDDEDFLSTTRITCSNLKLAPIEGMATDKENATSTNLINHPAGEIIAPKQTKVQNTSIKKVFVKKRKSSKIKLSLKKVTGAKKYEIQIARDKKFKKILVKKTVKKNNVTIVNKKMKNKKIMYVRVRVKGTKKWSKIEKIKIKK